MSSSRVFAALATLAALALGACGGTTVSIPDSNGAGDGGPTDGAASDAGASDAARDATRTDGAADAGRFACGTNECTRDQYCQITTGGPPPPPDAAPYASETCEPFPPQCANNLTCACLQKVGTSCQCTDANGHVTVQCFAP